MILARIFVIALTVVLADAGFARSYCVTKSGARLRKSPTSKAAVSWRVAKHMPLQGTGKRQGSWVEVKDMDGQAHWAFNSDLTTRGNCLVVRVKNTRLRTGPGSGFQASPLGVADKYMAFADLGGEDGWTQVEDDEGSKAWMNIDHVWKPTMKARVSFSDN